MSRFNAYFQNGFAGCRLLAEAHDNCRNRDVRIYQVPGEFDTVGVCDGTDCWMAPVAADPFSVSVRRILDDIRAGKDVKPVLREQPRARVRVQVTPTAKERVRAHT